MSALHIRDVRTILTMPDGGNRLLIVKIETSEPELYGLGCATFTQRPLAVRSAVDDYLKPLLIGQDPARIEDIWQRLYVNAYWRNGPVLGNALSGVDMALWDIKGKQAGMPLYELFGGKCREAASVYSHADGRTIEEAVAHVQSLQAEGFQYIRCQFGGYGGYSANRRPAPDGALPGAYYDPRAYTSSVLRLFEQVRAHVGDSVELLHDVHERLPPIDAINFARQLEPFRLFFLEDPLPPEQSEWLVMLRQTSTIPIALGELFNNPHEWQSLITRRLLDFVRVHISQIGGITPARKLALLCEHFGVRTAWHGPGDTSPVGHAANLHLDLSSFNFGVQEGYRFPQAVQDVFPGCPQIHNGYMYPNERPGLGIDLDEAAAARFPCDDGPPAWTLVRLPDGSMGRP